MKKATRSYNLRSATSRQVKKEGARSEVDDSVTQRVCKKIAKTIYRKGKETKIPSKLCVQAAEKIEELILDNSASLVEYKAKIVASIQRLAGEGGAVSELTERVSNGEFEEWARQFVSVPNE